MCAECAYIDRIPFLPTLRSFDRANPMSIDYTFQRNIDAPASKVFDALLDPNALRDWMPDLVELERVSDIESGPGVIFKETRKMFGRESTEYIEITDIQKPDRLHMYADGSKGTSGRGEYHFTYRLEPTGPDGNRTRLTLDCSIKDMGWFGGILLRLFSGPFEKSMKRDLDALADYVEHKDDMVA